MLLSKMFEAIGGIIACGAGVLAVTFSHGVGIPIGGVLFVGGLALIDDALD